MKVEIQREKRKTICLRVQDSENAVLKAPIKMSDKKIDEFLNSKRAWLSRISAKLRENEAFEANFAPLEKAYLHGECVGRFCEIVPNFDGLCDEKKRKAVKKFYSERFCDLEKQAKRLSYDLGIGFEAVRATTSHRIWGSFSKDKRMKLNIFLVALPDELAEYVIVHELCHSLQMNHSKRFWAEVARFCPDFKARKKALSNFSFLLKI